MSKKVTIEAADNILDFINASKHQLTACEYFSQTEANHRLIETARNDLGEIEGDYGALVERSASLEKRLAQLERDVRNEILREVGGSNSPKAVPPPQQQPQQLEPESVAVEESGAVVFDVKQKTLCHNCVKPIQAGAVAYRYPDGKIYCEVCESRAKQLARSA